MLPLPAITLKCVWDVLQEDREKDKHVEGLLVIDIANEDDPAVEHEPLSPCKAPLTQVPKGRPTKKGKRTEDYERRLERKRLKGDGVAERQKKVPKACSLCGGSGHNALRTCQQPHV